MPNALGDGAEILVERLAAFEPAAVCSGKARRQIDINGLDAEPPRRISSHVCCDVRVHGVGFEMRYQSAEGKLPNDLGFSAPRIDLGGFNYLATIRFGF